MLYDVHLAACRFDMSPLISVVVSSELQATRSRKGRAGEFNVAPSPVWCQHCGGDLWGSSNFGSGSIGSNEKPAHTQRKHQDGSKPSYFGKPSPQPADMRGWEHDLFLGEVKEGGRTFFPQGWMWWIGQCFFGWLAPESCCFRFAEGEGINKLTSSYFGTTADEDLKVGWPQLLRKTTSRVGPKI